MATNATIVLLGSRGLIGSYLLQNLSENYNVLADAFYSLEDIISDSFFLRHDVSSVVNCIGSYKCPSLYFKSNYLLPLHVTFFLDNFSSAHSRPVSLIHLSSVGITSPYSTFSLNYTPQSPFSREELFLNYYELSKLAFDTFLDNYKHSSFFSTYSLLLSNVVTSRSIGPSFTLCALLSPFRLDSSRLLPVTFLPDISNGIELVLTHKSPPSSHKSIPIYSRQSIKSFFPFLCFSYLKIPFPSVFISFLFPFRNYPILSRIYRFFVFLYRL